jgi:hypothetical protein
MKAAVFGGQYEEVISSLIGLLSCLAVNRALFDTEVSK